MFSTRLKILHINTEKGWRGGEEQVYLLIKGQKDRGHEPVLACNPNGLLFRRVTEEKVCPVIPFFSNVNWLLSTIRPFNNLLTERDFDIIHTHTSHGVIPGFFASAKFKHVRLFHSRRVDFPLGTFSRFKYLAGNSRIIAISKFIKQVLVNHGIPANRISLVYSGIQTDIKVDESSIDKYWEEFGIPINNKVIGVVAALTDHKGHKFLLDAFPGVLEQYPDTVLVIVGSGELESSLRSKSEKLGIVSKVRFTGFRTNARDIINMFDIFILPSHMEGLGTSLLDAMIREKPVISTLTGGIPEIVVHGKTGLLVPPRDPLALSKTIISLLGDSVKRSSMGREGKKRVLQQFSADMMVKGILSVYQGRDVGNNEHD